MKLSSACPFKDSFQVAPSSTLLLGIDMLPLFNRSVNSLH